MKYSKAIYTIEVYSCYGDFVVRELIQDYPLLGCCIGCKYDGGVLTKNNGKGRRVETNPIS